VGVSRLGAWVLLKMHEGRALVRFVGDFAAAGLASLIHPRQMRIREVLYHTQVVGTDAMPIVAGLSFLMGIIMAFQAATTLQTFGAAIYVADIVTISTTREMGPLLTAVIIAGRSGAAFAAEIGTMKINEEIDALEVMGFDITRFLVLPRVFALMLAGPLLTLLANAAGIAGGASAAVVLLNLSAVNFFAEVNKILSPADIYTGLIKGFGFAALVGFIGCFRGLRASMAAESVGVQATSAVVSGILLIIVADAVFTAIFQIYGW
jgi:phospholipid/cholesterol/gamma-HCH transport system permease protein